MSPAAHASAPFGRRPVPLRAFLLSALALGVPLAGQAAGWGADGAGFLIWLLALIPPFLLAYYRGWGGAATALAAGMALLALGEAFRIGQGLALTEWMVLFTMVATYVVVSLAAGALSEALHRQRLLAERRAGEVVWMLDGDQVIRYASPSTERVTGLPAEAFLGHRFDELDQVTVRPLPGAEEDPDTVPQDICVTTPEHGRRVIETRFEEGPGGDAFIAVGRDVTVQRRLQDRVKGSERLQALGRLAGGVAHDFNNVLTIITGHTELLLDDPDLPTDIRTSLDEVASAAEHAAGLTRQLLVFSRNRPVATGPHQVGPVVEQALPLVDRLLGSGIQLEADIEPGSYEVLVTPNQIEQILINLATNARDAMDGDEGRFELSVSRERIDADRAASYPYSVRTGRYVLLRARDDGRGMDPDTQARAFEPFFTTKPADRGTGLGLSTVYGIVKERGGYIWIDSEPGRGTTFDIYFPLVTGEPEDADRRASGEDALAKKAALVIEPDDDRLGDMREILQRVGFWVFEARSAQEGWDLAQGLRGDLHLAIAGLEGNGMSGTELGRRLRDRWPGLTVLFMAEEPDEAAAARRDVLTQPITRVKLLSRIDALAGLDPDT